MTTDDTLALLILGQAISLLLIEIVLIRHLNAHRRGR